MRKGGVMQDQLSLDIVSPDLPGPRMFDTAQAAVDRLIALYDGAVAFLCENFNRAMAEGHPGVRYVGPQCRGAEHKENKAFLNITILSKLNKNYPQGPKNYPRGLKNDPQGPKNSLKTSS